MFLGYPFLSPESVINRKAAVTTTKKENVFKEGKKKEKRNMKASHFQSRLKVINNSPKRFMFFLTL